MNKYEKAHEYMLNEIKQIEGSFGARSQMDVLYELVERDRPHKVIPGWLDDLEWHPAQCRECNHELLNGGQNFCDECGVRLEWRNEE